MYASMSASMEKYDLDSAEIPQEHTKTCQHNSHQHNHNNQSRQHQHHNSNRHQRRLHSNRQKHHHNHQQHQESNNTAKSTEQNSSLKTDGEDNEDNMEEEDEHYDDEDELEYLEEYSGVSGEISLYQSGPLFSPLKEPPHLPNTTFSVDSLDADSLHEDLILTCQANKDNYTIAFEGSFIQFSEDSDYHEAGKLSLIFKIFILII